MSDKKAEGFDEFLTNNIQAFTDGELFEANAVRQIILFVYTQLTEKHDTEIGKLRDDIVSIKAVNRNDMEELDFWNKQELEGLHKQWREDLKDKLRFNKLLDEKLQATQAKLKSCEIERDEAVKLSGLRKDICSRLSKEKLKETVKRHALEEIAKQGLRQMRTGGNFPFAICEEYLKKIDELMK